MSKKVLFSLLLVLGVVSIGKAEILSVGQRFDGLFKSFQTPVRLAVGESASPILFYQLGNGGAAQKRVGGVTPLGYWSVLSADFGGLTSDIADLTGQGSSFGGGSVHLDQVVSIMFPEVAALFSGIVPGTARNLVYRFQVGYGMGYDVNAEKFFQGFYAGPSFKF